MLMTALEYKESLRRFSPKKFINGSQITNVADEPLLAPGIAGVGVTYDFAHHPPHGGAGNVWEEGQPHASYK